MKIVHIILMIAMGLWTSLPAMPALGVAEAEVTSTCCKSNCRCDATAACPCAAPSQDQDQPIPPAVPPSERVSLQQLINIDPQQLYVLDLSHASKSFDLIKEQPLLPTRTSQRLSILCLRLV